ncbi:hypothetical protein LINPERHAP2_LOCUS44311, partial [Linum perenne]
AADALLRYIHKLLRHLHHPYLPHGCFSSSSAEQQASRRQIRHRLHLFSPESRLLVVVQPRIHDLLHFPLPRLLNRHRRWDRRSSDHLHEQDAELVHVALVYESTSSDGFGSDVEPESAEADGMVLVEEETVRSEIVVEDRWNYFLLEESQHARRLHRDAQPSVPVQIC